MSDPFTMRVVRHLLETPVELLSPVEQTARAGVFVALRPLVTTLAALIGEQNTGPTTDADILARLEAPRIPAQDTRGMGE
jgi:hypothetical protein